MLFLKTYNLLIKNPYKDDLQEMGMIPTFQKMFIYTNFKIISYKDFVYLNYFNLRIIFQKDFDHMHETYSYPNDKKITEKKI